MTNISDTVGQTYATARDTATQAYDTTLETARGGLDTSPLAILAGGIAVGVLAGALLPRTDKEAELLGPVGKRIADTASAAAKAARDVGKEQLDTMGLNRENAKDTVNKLVEGVTKAATSAGTAAAGEVKAATETSQPMTPGTSSQQY